MIAFWRSAKGIGAVTALLISFLLAEPAPAQTSPTPNPFGGTPEESNVPAPKRAKRAPAAPAALSAGQYKTEAEAKAACPGDIVVWANTSTKIYHYAGGKGYGTTKRGAYMCEKDTAAAGIRAAKNEKRKS